MVLDADGEREARVGQLLCVGLVRRNGSVKSVRELAKVGERIGISFDIGRKEMVVSCYEQLSLSTEKDSIRNFLK